MLKNEQFDEALDVSQSMDLTNTPAKMETKSTPNNMKGSADKFADQPFDEAADLSDSDESSVETNASPKMAHAKKPAVMDAAATKQAQDHALSSHPSSQRTHLSPAAGAPVPNANPNSSMEESQEESDTEESSSDSDEDDASGGARLNVEGAYNPQDYANLDVGGEIREVRGSI